MALGKKIYARYIKEGAEYELTLPGLHASARKVIDGALAAPETAALDLYAALHSKAFTLMATDLWGRFWDELKSQDAKDHTHHSGTALTAETPLLEVLRDPKEVTYFAEWLRAHLCEEHVLFWLEATDHKLLFSQADLQTEAQVETAFRRLIAKRAAAHWGSRRYDWFQNMQQGIAI